MKINYSFITVENWLTKIAFTVCCRKLYIKTQCQLHRNIDISLRPIIILFTDHLQRRLKALRPVPGGGVPAMRSTPPPTAACAILKLRRTSSGVR